MSADLLSRIKNRMDGFSKSQKLIAQYIIDHYDKAAYLTAGKMGTIVGVSESTVVRFAMELGFDGYPKMQKDLQEMVRNKLTSIQRIEATSDRYSKSSVLRSVLGSDMEKIRITLEEMDTEAFDGAVDEILGAKRIYILGVRSSASLASFLGFYFNLIFENVKLVQGISASEIFEQVLRAGEGDVVIGLSFPRYSRRTVQAMRFARNQGAKTVVITDSPMSPIAEFANYSLFAKSDMASFVDSLVAPLSLLNALIVAVGMRKREEVSGTFEKLERIWDEYEVYEKIQED